MALPVRPSSRKAQPPQMFPSAGKRLCTAASQLYHLATDRNQHHSKESYAQSLGLQSHWELMSTRLASRVENGKTQPPHWRQKTQTPHWRRKTQPPHWRVVQQDTIPFCFGYIASGHCIDFYGRLLKRISDDSNSKHKLYVPATDGNISITRVWSFQAAERWTTKFSHASSRNVHWKCYVATPTARTCRYWKATKF